MFADFPGLLANFFLFTGLLILLRTLDFRNEIFRLLFAALAIFLNIRYLQWRLGMTMDPFLTSPVSVWQWAFFTAELIAICSLSWHFIVFVQRPREPHEKGHHPYKPDRNSPAVDVFIATYNEEIDLLKPTIDAAKKINYPNLNIYVLDDGSREWLEAYCKKAGVRYITRHDRIGFKSGNLNNALRQTKGTYILCLDADFVVKPQIVTELLGYFDDPKIGLVQSPQHFSNPDAIQLNLCGGHSWPEEQRIFTDVMQPCRDNWDNAFCYGTNFVVRRDALNQIEGFPGDSVSEDLLLSYKLKSHGYITRFHRSSLATGKAADTLATFVGQRVRWCIGTLQCLFIKDGPVRARGLSLLDRIFYFDTVFYYLGSVWFFFVLIAPAIYWWTGHTPFASDNGHLLMMFAPRVLASTLVIYFLTERKVIPVISEIGRYAGIFHILVAIVITLIKPHGHVFKVTSKNDHRECYTFNWQIATPHLVLLFITLAGMMKTVITGLTPTENGTQNIGLILALTIFYFWVVFFTLLTCIEPPLKVGAVSQLPPTATGSFRKSLNSLLLKVTQ